MNTYNPFEVINNRLERIEKSINDLKNREAVSKSSDELLYVKSASEFLQISTATLYSKVSRGEIPVSRRGRKLVFSKNKLIEWSLQGERIPISEQRKQAIKKMQAARKI